MQRRLTLAMLAMVTAALLLSGLVSLFVAQRSNVAQTRHELVGEATGLARTVESSDADPATLAPLLKRLAPSMRLDGEAVVGVRPDGVLFAIPRNGSAARLPAGLKASDLSTPSLYTLDTVSGRDGSLVYAAVPFEVRLAGSGRAVVAAVILTRRPTSVLVTAGPWFAISAVVILVIAALVGWRLARRIEAPLRAAQEVTGRIAAGDLDVRVPNPPDADPELAALATSVNSMAESLGRAKAAERHFLQSVSHDLRTPLTSIRGFAEAIEDGATADAVAAAKVIASEARRLERLVGDLLALATLEARRFTLTLQPLDLYEAAVDSAAGFVPAAAEVGVRLEVTGTPGLVVGADPDRLGQIVANLVENALRYASSAVTVTPAPGPDGPELWVLDDGPGIAAEDLPKVFDRLYSARRQPDGARPGRPIGSGLGLSIVSELVAAMGGRVRAESPATPAGGTRMVVALPPASVRPAGF
jgi:signal transduction histidine kinase